MANSPSPYQFHIHHNVTTNTWNEYGNDLNDLFGGAQSNPFHRDAQSNKIALPSGQQYSDALQSLPEGDVYSAAGFGKGRHSGSHIGYDQFQQEKIGGCYTLRTRRDGVA